MKTFAWKILHGRVKTRPSGLNAPVTGDMRDSPKSLRLKGRKAKAKIPERQRVEGQSIKPPKTSVWGLGTQILLAERPGSFVLPEVASYPARLA